MVFPLGNANATTIIGEELVCVFVFPPSLSHQLAWYYWAAVSTPLHTWVFTNCPVLVDCSHPPSYVLAWFTESMEFTMLCSKNGVSCYYSLSPTPWLLLQPQSNGFISVYGMGVQQCVHYIYSVWSWTVLAYVGVTPKNAGTSNYSARVYIVWARERRWGSMHWCYRFPGGPVGHG